MCYNAPDYNDENLTGLDMTDGIDIFAMEEIVLEQRHRTKIRQLLGSPHQVAGYINVTDFQARRSRLSFHRI